MHQQRMDLTRTAPEGYAALLEADRAMRRQALEAMVRELVKTRVSQLNGCAFCVDKHSTEAREIGESEHRLLQLPVWRESPHFTDAERAALAYAEAATRLGAEGVSDEVWAALGAEFSQEEIGALVTQVALINALNRIAVPLRKLPPTR